MQIVLPQPHRSQYYDPQFIEWMNDHVDWVFEKLIGYDKCGEYNDGKAPSVYPTSYGPTTASHMKNLEVHSQP